MKSNIFWGFQKNEYFFGYEDFMDIFFFFLGGGGHYKIGLYLVSVLWILIYFLKVKVQNGRCFLGLVKFQMFWGDA